MSFSNNAAGFSYGQERKNASALNIVLIHAADSGRGAERCVIELHHSLQRLGHNSTLFVGRRDTTENDIIQIPYQRGLPGLRRVARELEKHFGWQDIYNPSFRNLINLIPENTDIVHFHSLWGSQGFADLSALPAITKRWPGIITMHENWLVTGHCACFHKCQRWQIGCGNCPDLKLTPSITKDGTRFNWYRKRYLLNKSRLHIVAVSNYLSEVARSSPIVSGKAISCIYNGIDVSVFKPASEEKRITLRQKLGIPEDAVTILLAGQTVEGWREGIATHYAVEALNQLKHNSVIPIIIGHSAAKVAEQMVHSAIVLPFQQTPSDMAACFQAADLCLVTSEVESFGRIAAESQACGTPVITFNAGGLPEVVNDGIGGYVVPLGDIKKLVFALEKCRDDKQKRAILAKRGREYVVKHFNQSLIADNYIDLYRQVSQSNANKHH